MHTKPQPQWLAKMYSGKVGRDHLGLGSVSSDQILPSLSPGINVLTFHPRYFSFYVFLLDEFWRRERPRTYQAWVSFYRPREFIFSLGGYLPVHAEECPEHGRMGNIVGGSITDGLARTLQTSYDTQTYYIKSELGGYGLYYRSVMAELGVIFPGGRGFPYPVDVPSEKGKEVAAAFRQAIQNTEYYRTYFDQDATHVPLAVIRDYMKQACLCQLQRPQTPDRPIILDMFLNGGNEQAAAARRATFQLLLDITQQTQGHTIDQDTFRQLLYFQTADNGATYSPQENVKAIYRRWRLYQAREYYALALNVLWNYLCDWGLTHHGDIRPLPLASFWTHLDDAIRFETVAAALQLPAPKLNTGSGFQSLLDWVKNSAALTHPDLDAPYNQIVPVQEHRLLTVDGNTTPTILMNNMIIMLALIYLRFDEAELWRQPEWEIAQMGENGRLSFHRFIQQMRSRLRSGPVTIGEIVRWWYDDYIILQHQVIAANKLPDNTFRFRREGDRLMFFNLDNSLGFMDSRFYALTTTIHELGLCGNLAEPDHPLTEEGWQLLLEGELTWMP